jgi:hypothetical protein
MPNERTERGKRAALAIVVGLVAALTIAGCGKQNSAVTQAARKDAAAGVPAPGIAETKAIAEEAYVYGFPMVAAMKRNPDGSLTIDAQKDSPGKAKEANWLPAPNGPIYMAMRLYWPRTELPSILPAGEGTWSPPPIVAAN